MGKEDIRNLSWAQNNHSSDAKYTDHNSFPSSESFIASIKHNSFVNALQLCNMSKLFNCNSHSSNGEKKREVTTDIPHTISFMSHAIQDAPNFNDNCSTGSNPDICPTDVDVSIESCSNKEEIDSDVSQHPIPILSPCNSDNNQPSDSLNQQIYNQSDHIETVCRRPLETNESKVHAALIVQGSRFKTAGYEIQNLGGKYNSCFILFRLKYLIVHSVIMLADGLQGTHLYVLYEGYGYSVSTLYSLGFLSGALTSAFIGPVVDKIGRKRSAIIYCFLELIINQLEQYPMLTGLIVSRIVGGITTNLLHSVFESYLITEHRKRGFEEEKLEIIHRDSTIVSNLAAIISGYIAHCLATKFGNIGPFQGAVFLTAVALFLIGLLWNENYGKSCMSKQELYSWRGSMIGAYRTIVASSTISRIGIIQGLTEGVLQTFVFLWPPALRAFAATSRHGLGLEKDKEPAYGLIFGCFMSFGVIGGFFEPTLRKTIDSCTSIAARRHQKDNTYGELDSVTLHLLCTTCYLISSILLITPCYFEINGNSQFAYSFTFGAFLLYEFIIGLYLPCEGIIRSIHMPNESVCSVMTMLRVIVNIAVAIGVISTNFIPITFLFGIMSTMMIIAAVLQVSLIDFHDLQNLCGTLMVNEKKNC